MLSPATKKWEDQSTTTNFKFLFFCDCCGKSIPSLDYEFQSGFKPKLLMHESERRARELIWQRERAIRQGVSKSNAVGKAIGNAVQQAIEPKTTELANKTAAKIEQATLPGPISHR